MYQICNDSGAFQTCCRLVEKRLYKPSDGSRQFTWACAPNAAICKRLEDTLTNAPFRFINIARIHWMKYSFFLRRLWSHERFSGNISIYILTMSTTHFQYNMFYHPLQLPFFLISFVTSYWFSSFRLKLSGMISLQNVTLLNLSLFTSIIGFHRKTVSQSSFRTALHRFHREPRFKVPQLRTPDIISFSSISFAL